MNASGVGVSRFWYTSWCSGTGRRIGADNYEPAIPIEDGAFTIRIHDSTFRGSFDADDSSASGSWTESGCSGDWVAAPEDSSAT